MTACPNCGSRYLRPARPRDLSEKLGAMRFMSPLRCLDCKHRFIARTLEWSDLVYSRCPICLRQDLNAWSGKTYEPPFWTAVKLAFGAKRWRCEYCRINFASFRKRREIFSFSRWKKMSLPGLPEPAETPADLRRQEAAYVKARPGSKSGQRWDGSERRGAPRDEQDEDTDMDYARLRELAQSLKADLNRGKAAAEQKPAAQKPTEQKSREQKTDERNEGDSVLTEPVRAEAARAGAAHGETASRQMEAVGSQAGAEKPVEPQA